MSIFNLDSPVMRFLGRVADLMILNIIALLCCIPIVTAGASFTALNYMALKIVRNEDCYIVKGYFKSFKQNFRQATILWMIMLAFVLIIYGDYKIITTSGMEFPKALKVIIIAFSIVVAMIGVYIFPVLSRYDNTIKNTIKNSFIMAIIGLPKTVVMVVIWCLPLAALLVSFRAFPFVFMFGLSLPTLLCAYLYNGIFKRFEPDIVEETTDPDQWHVYKEGEEELAKIDKEQIEKEIQENLEEIGNEVVQSDN